jgi:DNA repair exonuclease SbcCD ATPase subunit
LKQEFDQQQELLQKVVSKLEESHAFKMQLQATRLNNTIDQLTQKLEQQKGLLQSNVSELQENLASKIQLQARNYKTKEEGLLRQLSEAKRNHEREVEELELEHESSLQVERDTHSATIEKMKQDHEEEKSRWQTDLAKEKEKCAPQKLQLTAEYNQRHEKIKEEHKSQLGKLTAKLDKIEDKHAAELRKLRGSFEHEIEAYSAALLARDKFMPLSDPDISVMFMALKQDVDALSLLEWKADRKKWPDKVLCQLSDNQRSLKQQILQNIIWRSLYEYIFCSPFRVLGEEGKLLEKQWNDKYSQGLFHAFLGQLILLGVR